MINDNEAANNQEKNSEENPMSILEKRLAEINARKKDNDISSSKTEPAEASNSHKTTEAESAAQEREKEISVEDTSVTVENTPVSSSELERSEKDNELQSSHIEEWPVEEAGKSDEQISGDVNEIFESEEEFQPIAEQAAVIDLANLSIGKVMKELHNLMNDSEAKKNVAQINEAYRIFQDKIQEEKTEALQRFIEEGGSKDDFEFRMNKEQKDIESEFQKFRESRFKDAKREEEQRVKNLARKKEILAEIRQLVNAEETSQSFEELKKLQAEWKAIGPVPQNEAKEIWQSYDALLDMYYSRRSLYNEFKELDRKKNLQAKTQLCERAEALVSLSSINKSLSELRKLHDEWKNIGPVPNEERESIWSRFIAASTKIQDKKKEYIAQRNATESKNLQKKIEVITKVESYIDFNSDRINDWREKTDELQKIKEEWESIGLVPKENADQINRRFWTAFKTFFQNKSKFFKGLDDQKMQNLKLKEQLCLEAEALKDSNDWETTKEKLIQLQKKWKTIGRVPEKVSEEIWQRFRSACNEFFDRFQNDLKKKEDELDVLASEKIAYCNEIASLVQDNTHQGSFERFNEILAKWNSLDVDSKRYNQRVEDNFFKMLEKYVDTIPGLSYEQKNELLFNLNIAKLKGAPDAGKKLGQKEQAIKKEITEIENDIRTLKTNIEFFSKSKNADKLKEEYEGKINHALGRIETLKKQLEFFYS